MVWQPEVDELKRRHAMADAMGGPEGFERQRKRGKLMVRERLDMLVDPGSFQQMGKLAGHAQYDADGALTAFTPGSRLRGVAKVNGRRVWLQATDFSVRGASGHDDDGGVDIGHGHPDALELRLPAVFLIDTAGGSVNEYNELGRTYIPDGPEYSESVSNQLSLAPVVSVVLGPAAGGAAPLPPLAHFSVMSKGTGQVFPGGPPVVKAALGIEIDKEDLGGWRIHTRGSGVVDNAAESEADAIEQAKRFLSYLPDNVWQMPPRGDTSDDPNRRDERLLSLVPRDIRKVYDPYVMIAGVFDAGSFFEIAPGYGRSRVIGLARTHGYPIGVITSNPKYKGGSMDTAAAEKSTRLVQLCDTFHIPVVILLDEPGFQVGVESEKQGVERAGARLMHAMLQSTHALGVDHPAADVRPGRRHPVPRGAAPLSPLRLGLGTLGVDAHRGRDRRRLPARHRRSARPRREARGDRGRAAPADLALPHRRGQRPGPDRPARHAVPALRLRGHGAGRDQDAARPRRRAHVPPLAGC